MGDAPKDKKPAAELITLRNAMGDADANGTLTEKEIFAGLENKTNPPLLLEPFLDLTMGKSIVIYENYVLHHGDPDGTMAAKLHAALQKGIDAALADTKKEARNLKDLGPADRALLSLDKVEVPKDIKRLARDMTEITFTFIIPLDPPSPPPPVHAKPKKHESVPQPSDSI